MANNIKAIFTNEYPDVAITDSIWSVVADTTGCARNVADHFDDASQIDCAMHSGSLGLQYAFGMKDNTRNTAGIRTIITPGSNGVPYTAADEAVKDCWSLVDFCTTERRSRLEKYALVNNLSIACQSWTVTHMYHHAIQLFNKCCSAILYYVPFSTRVLRA